jgi:cysteinyl-tRNA synthetase
LTTGNLQLYDTMTRTKRLFEPLQPEKVKLYACGPTVYGDPHIGNFRSFVSADLLRRWLDYRGYDVTMIVNVTDIDDKTIRDSAKAGEPIKYFTQKYTRSFLRGLDLLNIRRASAYPRATEYIPQMLDFIQQLIDKGAAYVAEDGVYFDIDKNPEYGRLSGMNLKQVQTTERMAKDEYDKENAQDFALWKKSTVEELDRSNTEPGLSWDSPWGKGRPGWHIECSVMTRDLLGDTLDIHAGGEDLVFPHHTNEIAQSETLTGKQFVRYWVHIRHLMINGKKMSKSLGNYVSFDEVLAKYSADSFRYFYLGTHYRRPLDYTDDAMKSAEGSAKRLENTLDLLDAALKGPDINLDINQRENKLLNELEKQGTAFEVAMDDDLDSHTALDVLHAISGAINEYLTNLPNKGVALRAYILYKGFLDALGLFENRSGGADDLTNKLIKTMIEMRNHFRKEKNYAKADEIRNNLVTMGVILVDSGGETSWKIEKQKSSQS